MIAEVGSPHLKACLDAPLAARQGVSSMQQAAKERWRPAGAVALRRRVPSGPRTAVRGFVRNPDMTLTPEDYYVDFVQGMHEIGYEDTSVTSCATRCRK